MDLRQADSPEGRVVMQEFSYSSGAIREALRFVEDSNIPDNHKRVLVGVVLHALRNVGAVAFNDTMHSESEPWQQHEVQTLAAHLEGKRAVNWQHADELVMWLVACLRRNPEDIRKKALELGFGAGVDYRIAKSTSDEVAAEA
jgi:hypothetical protein